MHKLIKSNYDKQCGMSYVKIETDIGVFEGYAFLDPEDKDTESKFFGCRLANYRAEIKYLEERIFRLNLELNELYLVMKNMPMMKSEYNYLKKRIEDKENLRNNCKRVKKEIKDYIKISIEERDKILEKIKKSKEKEENK